MKKIKILIVFIFLLLLCGCQKVTEEVTVNYDGKVKEKIIFEHKTKDISNKKEVVMNYLQSAIDSHKTALEFGNYKSKILYGENVSKVEITNQYDDICSYFTHTVFSQYVYKFITCKEEDGFIEIKNKSEYITYKSDYSNWPKLGDVTFKLTLPVKALESDADKVDRKTYIWKYDKKTDSSKSLYLKISKNDLEENKEKIIRNNKIRSFIIKTVGIGLIIIVVLIIGKLMYTVSDKNKQNY